jgi:hypothetical protein
MYASFPLHRSQAVQARLLSVMPTRDTFASLAHGNVHVKLQNHFSK